MEPVQRRTFNLLALCLLGTGVFMQLVSIVNCIAWWFGRDFLKSGTEFYAISLICLFLVYREE